jgi:hypothetical protein
MKWRRSSSNGGHVRKENLGTLRTAQSGSGKLEHAEAAFGNSPILAVRVRS